MNICTESKILYIHIPKTAGMSIARTLGLENPEHLTQNEIVKQNASIIDLRNYYKFAFCRNPWDRMVSLYSYCISGSEMYGKFNSPKIEKIKELFTFKLFCQMLGSGFFIGNNFIWKAHYRQQLDFINVTNIDFIGRFENLQEDFYTVCDNAGIPRQELQHINKSNRKHYTEYYDDETKQIVAEKYAKDIEYFGYKFGD